MLLTKDQKQDLEMWVHYLRSGMFKQETGRLRGDNGYCCLGVACKLMERNGGGYWINVGVVWRFAIMEDGMLKPDRAPIGDMPFAVQEKIGIYNANPRPFEICEQATLRAADDGNEFGNLSLAFLNDTVRLTFSQIADVIQWAWLSQVEFVEDMSRYRKLPETD